MEQTKGKSEQPFEAHEELAAILYHAAHVWKTDMQWSPLLSEINTLCARLQDLESKLSDQSKVIAELEGREAKYKEALERIAKTDQTYADPKGRMRRLAEQALLKNK